MLMFYLTAFESDADKQTFEEIYVKYKDAAFRAALKIKNNRAMAEDALHNGFLRLINNWEKFLTVPCDKRQSLIVIIVKNKCIDLKRQQSRRAYDQLDDMENTLESSDMPVEDQVVLDDEYSALRKCLTALDETSRLVLEMKFVLGMTYKEIGVELGMTANHVDTKIMRAKAKVRKLIAEGGDQNGE